MSGLRLRGLFQLDLLLWSLSSLRLRLLSLRPRLDHFGA